MEDMRELPRKQHRIIKIDQIQKSAVSLGTSNGKNPKMKFKRPCAFKITHKKLLREKNLTSNAKELYTDSYKTLLREFK